MVIDWHMVWEIAKPLFAAIVGATVARAVERRPHLIAFFLHVSANRFSGQNPGTVHTHAVVVRNTGKRPATNVRITHRTLPDYTIYPDVMVQVIQLPGGGTELVFPSLVPGEQITISYLYFPPLTFDQIHAGIRFDEGFARQLHVLPTPQLSSWQLWGLRGLIVIGAIATIYAALEVPSFLWGRLSP